MDYEITIITSILNGKDFIKGFLEDVERQTMFKQSQLVMVDANSDEYEETEKHIHPFVKIQYYLCLYLTLLQNLYILY